MKPFAKTLLAMTLAGTVAGAAQAEDKVLHVYNWSDYIAEDTLENFTKETGIKVVDLLEPYLQGGKIGLPPLHFGRVEGSGTLVPVDHGQRDPARFGAGAYPHVDQAPLRRRDDGARDGGAEPLHRSHHRRQLRHGQRSAQIATGFPLQIEQRRIGAEQPAFTRQGGPQDRRIGGWRHAGALTGQDVLRRASGLVFPSSDRTECLDFQSHRTGTTDMPPET